MVTLIQSVKSLQVVDNSETVYTVSFSPAQNMPPVQVAFLDINEAAAFVARVQKEPEFAAEVYQASQK